MCNYRCSLENPSEYCIMLWQLTSYPKPIHVQIYHTLCETLLIHIFQDFRVFLHAVMLTCSHEDVYSQDMNVLT